MTDPGNSRTAGGLPAEINSSIVALWRRHTGVRPTDACTEIRGNVVTCVLHDAGCELEGTEYAPQRARAVRTRHDRRRGSATFEIDAAAAVSRITRQRVSAFISRRDAETGVATETFTLEPSLGRGSGDLADRGGLERRYRLRLVDGRHGEA